MRKILKYVLPILLIMCLAGCGNQYDMMIYNTNNSDTESKLITYEDEYNEDGKITKAYHYDENNVYYGYSTFQYKDADIIEREYDKNDQPVRAIYTEIVFNDGGGFSRNKRIYNADGDLEKLERNTYDDNVNMVEDSIFFYKNDEITTGTITVFQYDENRNVIEELCVDENENIKYHKLYEYNIYNECTKIINYDEYGNMTEELK